MIGSPSRAIRLFGTEEPVAATRALRAGPLEATLDAGNLRCVRLHGREAIRAISYVVRDRDWGTYAPRFRQLSAEEDADGFRVNYEAVCEDGAQALVYRAGIVARARGGLVFEVEGEAASDFVTNRAGFVVLHGAAVSGAPVEVEHVDGRVERRRFPELIDPACPFRDVRALTHEVLPDLRVACRMEGDAFETEDQRNWTDASYKTYVRPLARPRPYTIRRGERFVQRVSLEVVGAPRAPAVARAGAAIAVRLSAEAGHAVPAVGLAAPVAHLEAALGQVDALRELRPAFVMAEVDGRAGHGAEVLARHAALARALDADLVLEAVLPCVDAAGRPTDDPGVLRRDLDRLRRAVGEARARPARLAVAPACDLKSCQPDGPWPSAPRWAELIGAARAAFPGIPVGGGSLAYFTELNRKRPPAGLLDFIGHGTCPIVHAADDVSLMESLEALPAVFASAAAFAGEAPRWLFPTAISMRANPYGAAPAANPARVRLAMAEADPRERSLIGAAWYAGYLAHAARAGLAAVALAAVAGPAGVVAPGDPAGARLRPSYHVLRGHAGLRGGRLLPTSVAAPGEVQALAACLPDGGLQLWLVNLTGSERAVEVAGLPSAAGRLALIDEAAFERLGDDPTALEAGERALSGGSLALSAYAVARLSFARPR